MNPHKTDKWLKKVPAKKLCIEDNANNASKNQQENGRANSSLTHGMSYSSATLSGKNQ